MFVVSQRPWKKEKRMHVHTLAENEMPTKKKDCQR